MTAPREDFEAALEHCREWNAILAKQADAASERAEDEHRFAVESMNAEKRAIDRAEKAERDFHNLREVASAEVVALKRERIGLHSMLDCTQTNLAALRAEVAALKTEHAEWKRVVKACDEEPDALRAERDEWKQRALDVKHLRLKCRNCGLDITGADLTVPYGEPKP